MWKGVINGFNFSFKNTREFYSYLIISVTREGESISEPLTVEDIE